MTLASEYSERLFDAQQIPIDLAVVNDPVSTLLEWDDLHFLALPDTKDMVRVRHIDIASFLLRRLRTRAWASSLSELSPCQMVS